MNEQYKMLINGRLCAAQRDEQKAVINPANQKTIALVPQAEQQDVTQAIAAARQAFDQGPWPRFSLVKRKEMLLRIAQGILDHCI